MALAALCASAVLGSPALADVASVTCGATIKRVIKSSYNTTFTTSSTTYVTLPSAGITFTVPSGQTQCAIVKFSAQANCASASLFDHCYIRPVEVNEPPGFVPAAVALSSEPTDGTYSFEWARRFAAGTHTIRIQASANAIPFEIDAWTYDLELTK